VYKQVCFAVGDEAPMELAFNGRLKSEKGNAPHQDLS
jgi:hypothetical protein